MKRGTMAAAALMMVWAVSGAWARPAPAPSTEPAPEPLAYTIQVHLDPSTHTLVGTESVRWKNTTSISTDAVWLHLYLNAFASNRSTFMRESRGRQLRSSKPVKSWGWTRITSAAMADGTDLLPGLSFERPDDGNPDDFTVAKLKLPQEVSPGETVEFRLAFEARLPRVVARTGWAGGFHMVGQWFPKLGVLTDAGWNCHQFHANSEFFADFADYRVTVTVPEGWVVGATGVETSRTKVAEGSERGMKITFEAQKVHDFAWTAAPAALMKVVEADFDPARDIPRTWLEKAAEELKVSTADLDLPPVHLRLLIPRDQSRLAGRELRAARLAMAWYGLHYGPYPYPQLTIVSPPAAAREAGGMEYPTLITTGGSRWLSYPPFQWTPFLDTVVIHEFGHQYFYGMLASNEFEQAWLDEGLNSYAEASCTSAILRDGLVPELKPWPGDPWTTNRMSLLGRRNPITVDTFSWKFRVRGDYFAASYAKTALALHTLEGLVGAAPFARAMRHYATSWRFRHPTGRDFQHALEESLGRDLGWFFDQAIRGDAQADWAVLSVRQREAGGVKGWVWKGGSWVKSSEHDAAPTKEGKHWNVEVDVGRRGDLVGPLTVELRWNDGTRERKTWDGKGRWHRWRFTGAKRLDAVIADPDGVWALETRRDDNYWRREPSSAAVHKALWWTGELVRAAAGLLIPWS